jgi:hypothetical protein
MNQATALALTKWKDNSAQLEPGTHKIDALVHLQGEIEVLPNETNVTSTVSLPPLEIMALFIARAGFTRERTMELIRECCGEAIAKTGKGKDSLKNVKMVKETIAKVKKEITSKLPKVERRGKTFCRVEATQVSALPEAA